VSTIPLEELKDFLNVTHASDDAKLRVLLNAAEDEALRFMNRTTFGEICEESSLFDADTATIPDSVVTAVYFLVSAMYDAQPDHFQIFRKAAERMMMPLEKQQSA